MNARRNVTSAQHVVLLAVLVLGLAGCGSHGVREVGGPRVTVESIQKLGDARAPLVEEKGYDSLRQLAADSTAVVVAEPTSDAKPAEGFFDPATPVAVQGFRIVRTLKGSFTDGAPLDVSVLARLKAPRLDGAGKITGYDGLSTDYTEGETYLLYLRPAPVGTWLTPTSTLSGSFRKYAGLGFVKPTSANPGLPDVVTPATALG